MGQLTGPAAWPETGLLGEGGGAREVSDLSDPLNLRGSVTQFLEIVASH